MESGNFLIRRYLDGDYNSKIDLLETFQSLYGQISTVDSMEHRLPIDSCELVVVRIAEDYSRYAKWNPVPPKKARITILSYIPDFSKTHSFFTFY